MTTKKIGVVVEEEREVEFIPEEVVENVVSIVPKTAVLLGDMTTFDGKHTEAIFPGTLGHDGFYVWSKLSWIIEHGGIVYLTDSVTEEECEHATRRFDKIPGERAYRRR
jgi:hypothetical protein